MRYKSGTLEKQERCLHTSRSKEVIGGQKTGDTVCHECGEAFAPSEKIVPPEFRYSMIVSSHALLVALSVNSDLALSKDVARNSFVFEWALINKRTKEMVIPVAADVALACLEGGHAATEL